MLRPSPLLPALRAAAAAARRGRVRHLAVLLLIAGTAAGPALVPAVSAAPAPHTTLALRADEQSPLLVSIDALTPSAVPASGPIRVSGTVTNTDDATWSDVNLYAFISTAPITSATELADAAGSDPQTEVGQRITAPGTYDKVGELAPGASATYSLRIPRSELGVSAPGVYWFGVHALGGGPTGREEGADGRARTFLPLLPRGTAPVETALVVPLRAQLRFDRDGSLEDVDGWTRTLSSGGRLRGLIDFATAAGPRPITWLLDPAVPDAVRALAAGNPARSLAPANAGDGGTESASPSATPSAPQDAPPASLNPSTPEAVTAAQSWLKRLEVALRSRSILALPYGDPDVSATAASAPRLLAEARARTGDRLPSGQAVTPAIGAPNGYLDPTVLGDGVPQDTLVLVTDRMFDGTAPPVATAAGVRLVTTSSGAASGGPGPGPRLAAVALRQRILAEAALRALDAARPPLVVQFPQRWSPRGIAEFLQGLDVGWLRLSTVPAVAQRAATPVEQLLYPDDVQAEQVDPANVRASVALRAAGRMLESTLTQDSLLADTVTGEALADLSYANRRRGPAARASADRSRAWIRERLASITITSPRSVTLSSASGRFATTVTNGLDQPVSVALVATSDPSLEVSVPERIDLAAGESQTVLLAASTTTPGVHRVSLVVTNLSGVPLGASDSLPVRSAQVSNVIWLILGTGISLLFAAIAVRLFRRVRAARGRQAAA